jgi:hypothetical protein
MATQTGIPLATTTLTSNAYSVTFSSISGSYRDLLILLSGSATDYEYVILQFNSDTGSNYTFTNMIGDGNGVYGGAATINGARVGRLSTTANVRGNLQAHIMDYSSTDKNTTTLARGNSPDEMTMGIASRWANSAAITSVTVTLYGGTALFETGTTISLFGVDA